MSSNRYKGIKRCKSMPAIDDEIVKEVFRKAASKKMPSKTSTSKKEYMGRRSLGVAGVSAKVKRKKSKTERDRVIYDDRDIYEDEGYVASASSSTGTYRCIPVLERSTRTSNTYLPSVESSSSENEPHRPPLLYSLALSLAPPQNLSIESLTGRLEELEVTDRNKLHLEITQFLKKAEGEKSKQVQVTQRVMECPQFGQTRRLIVEESGHSRYTFENVLWLILKTYFSASFAGRDIMVERSEWMAEDEKIVRSRQQYMMVMDKIKEFKFELIKSDDTSYDSLNRRMEFSPDYCKSLCDAKKQVTEILDMYDTLVDLFPTQSALWKLVEQERGEVEKTLLEGRMTSMRVWLNTLNDMDDKLRDLGVLFEVGSMKGGEASWFRPLEPSNQIFALEDVGGVFLEYVKKSLNLKGMKKVLTRVEKIIELTLVKTAILMQKPPTSYAAATASKGAGIPFSQTMKYRYGDMAEWRFCNTISLSLNLPPLTHLFFFLVAVPMQLVVHWLEIRSATEPPDSTLLDELTFDAMITDSRDCVEEAVRIKKNYLTIISSMCSKCVMPGFLYPLNYNTYVLDVFKVRDI
uniref:Uncharacterized protein n=1 Tax=Caenorhabditis japonica TaxID=281687 RepID=A0A8R1IMK9_CAEJA